MKDPDSSSDVKKEANADEMSLADLLGAGDAADEGPKRVDHRDDEPDSGMVNLAKMVADSSVEVARTPSIAPPPADPTGSHAVADPSGVVQTYAAPPPVAQKKGSGAIIGLIVAVLVVGGIVIYMLSRDSGSKDDAATLEATQQLLAQVKELQEQQRQFEEQQRAQAEEKAKLEAALAAMKERSTQGADAGEASAEDQAKMAELQKQIDEAKAKEEELAKKAEEAAKKADVAKGGAPTKKAASSGAKKETDKGTAVAAAEKPAKTTSKKSEEPAPATKKSGTDELDSLLGGPKKAEPEETAKKPAAPSTPAKPSKADVTAAMGPVQARAQSSCAKYSTGTVQVQVTVASSGKVTNATPTGAFAGNQAGQCVAMMARSAKFPKFSDPTFSFTYPIILK